MPSAPILDNEDPNAPSAFRETKQAIDGAPTRGILEVEAAALHASPAPPGEVSSASPT